MSCPLGKPEVQLILLYNVYKPMDVRKILYSLVCIIIFSYTIHSVLLHCIYVFCFHVRINLKMNYDLN